MQHGCNVPRFPDNFTSGDRIRRAKHRASRLVDHILALFQMHEANRIVVYSDALARQIPRSFAAHAFNQFQMSMHLFEVVRLCALWDPVREDRESIPTILALVNTPALIDQLAADTYDHFIAQVAPRDLNPSTDPELEAAKRTWWEGYRVQRAEEEAAKARERLAVAAAQAEAVATSPELRSLRAFRDAHIAHNLDLPEPHIDEVALPARRVVCGDEAKVLEQTVSIADALQLGINGSSFDWEGSRAIARKNAAALWDGCTIHVKR